MWYKVVCLNTSRGREVVGLSVGRLDSGKVLGHVNFRSTDINIKGARIRDFCGYSKKVDIMVI